MSRILKWAFTFAFLATCLSTVALGITAPNPQYTPGSLCTPNDPNFQGYAFAEHIARCVRNVNDQEKEQIAQDYGGIPHADWRNYEFDHLIPLCAGGSDDISNVWPQPIDEAKQKDKVEDDVCNAMRAGTMTQAQAVAQINAFFSTPPSVP